jgi:hypothetical protein
MTIDDVLADAEPFFSRQGGFSSTNHTEHTNGARWNAPMPARPGESPGRWGVSGAGASAWVPWSSRGLTWEGLARGWLESQLEICAP